MSMLEKHTECKWILLYIERWLKVPMQLKDGTVSDRNKGTPQGGVISPLLANLYLHYAFDKWMQETNPLIPFERYADDIVVHCRSEKQAKWLQAEIKKRLAEFKLELHPKKTKIVYCKDSNRRGGYENEKFTFLGFEFRPRSAKNKYGGNFLSFIPAVSSKAKKEMYEEIRNWNIQRHTDRTIEEIARYINPIVVGWINYYGNYYKSALKPITTQIDRKLIGWCVRKYKRMRRSYRRSRRWLNRIKRNTPNLFAPWRTSEI
jgi:group II intron reverse transcriptase/maturase